MRKRRFEEVADYNLIDRGGRKVGPSRLFGNKNDLIPIHNMGRSCPMCTMWANGFNGVLRHLEDRAAFAVVSSDPPAIQRKFARSRGWKFQMLSARGASFIKDMGFGTEDDPRPGISVFQKKGRRILGVATDGFGPGDPYCVVYHLFNLLPSGVSNWHSTFRYGRK